MKHGQQVTEFGVPPLPQKNTPKKPASTSLRASCFLAGREPANCPPKVAKTLTRHSTISLTMDRYTHLGTDDLVAGLKRLPVMAGGND